MYVNNDGMTVHFGEMRVAINAAHICITDAKTKKTLFSRENAGASEWYDGNHVAIVKAINALENALHKAAQEEHEVRATHDGVEGEKIHFRGQKSECLSYIRTVWNTWKKKGITPSLWHAGKPISFVA